jgi:anion-transporting  ArsA/GET3 family ATPase
LAELVADHRIVVCVGSGGVGKTTTAASLALWGALQGRRAIVLTIDPARRLADSLGIGPIGNTPRDVPRETLRGLDPPVAGSLTAMMLDQKSSWDELVARYAPQPEVRERILENAFYRQLSQSFAGSQEYMAVEQLGELEASGRFDLIIVDTPPTQHALDFLEAPDRLLAFLDRRIVKWFVRPSMSAGWSTLQSMNRTVGFLLRKIEDATGVGALSQVSAFFGDMDQLFEGFEGRVERVTSLLRDSKTAFVLVAGPDEQILDQVDYLAGQMADRHMPLKGVVMNRVHGLAGALDVNGRSIAEIAVALDAWVRRANELTPTETGKARGRSAGEATAQPLASRLARNLVCWQVRARGDALRIEMFRQGLPRGVPLVQVPDLPREIHDLDGLHALHAHLFSPVH